ncbi:hypothetical protein BZA05DRAFT_434895 [Tricharina praecox]|uniref:uncharacterized protein n=1 Tax=Tricharina praecox TaxID=43433 RepID=UPI00221F0BDA|nr:uncharacterized protein BZA05DRAFT_434895 [Tricharina praecox]KAI5854637.1 hypothetical protein BZA05DRAFT_434895 [Tricharina praecox]
MVSSANLAFHPGGSSSLNDAHVPGSDWGVYSQPSLSTDPSGDQIRGVLVRLSAAVERTTPLILRATYLHGCLSSVTRLARNRSPTQPDQVPLEDPKVLLPGVYRETRRLLGALRAVSREMKALHREWGLMHLLGVFDTVYGVKLSYALVQGGVDALSVRTEGERRKGLNRQGTRWLGEWEANACRLAEAEATLTLTLGWAGAELRRLEKYVVVFPGPERRWEWRDQTEGQGQRGARYLHDAERDPDFELTENEGKPEFEDLTGFWKTRPSQSITEPEHFKLE